MGLIDVIPGNGGLALSTVGAGGNAGALAVFEPQSTPQGGQSAANAALALTVVGVAGRRVRLTHLAYGYSAVAPPAAGTVITIADGTTTLDYVNGPSVGMNFPSLPPGGLGFAVGATVTVTIPAGGAGAVGNLDIGSVVG